jgi:hypothetical protein
MERTFTEVLCRNARKSIRRFSRELADRSAKMGRRAIDKGAVRCRRLSERATILWKRLEATFFSLVAALTAWWDRRGWPASPLAIGAWLLFCLPFNVALYLLGCGRYHVALNYRWLAAWLLVAGIAQAISFWYKEIRPDPPVTADRAAQKVAQELRKGFEHGDNDGTA